MPPFSLSRQGDTHSYPLASDVPSATAVNPPTVLDTIIVVLFLRSSHGCKVAVCSLKSRFAPRDVRPSRVVLGYPSVFWLR